MTAVAHCPSESAQCSYCELPLTHDTAPDAAGQHYCCYGCRFAATVAAASGDEAQSRWMMTRLGLAIFFSMNVMVCTLLLWSETGNAEGQLSAAWYDLFRYASCLFSIPVIVLLAPPVIDDAWRELAAGRTSTSVLLVIGVTAAVGYSLYSVCWGGHIYWEVACAILLGVTLGKWFEAQGKLQTTAALRAMAKLLPDTVRVIRDDSEAIMPAAELRTGDCFRVLPGERIVADGNVQQGEALVDEQAVTGESLPITKSAGSPVFSGTLVIDSPLVVVASAPAGEGTIAQMIAAVRQCAAARTRYEQLAERISQWFLPVVMLIATVTFLVHLQRGELERGLLAAVAVLVIACPCSLGLATPMALWAAIARAAQAGILIRSGDALTQFAGVRTICFDKTGTLTTGQPKLFAMRFATGADAAQIVSLVQPLIADSSHPLAQAVTDWTAQHPLNCRITGSFEQIRHVPGRGVVGVSQSLGEVYLGNRRWLESLGVDCAQLPAPTDSAAETLLAWNKHAQAQFLFSEELRPDVDEVLRELVAGGLRPLMLTGDREARAAQLAATLGISYQAELLPEDKLRVLREIGERPVAMVGDGINDAPALAQADVGISLASGTDIARNTASVCLLQNHLRSLPFLRRLALRTRRALHWNLVWALGYNVIGVALASIGWIHPAIAAVAMGLSGLLVVGNSLTLARFESAETTHDGAEQMSLAPLPADALFGSSR